MIKIEIKNDDLLEVTLLGTLKAEDFEPVGIKVEDFIKENDNAHVLVNLTSFEGWEDLDAAGKHLSFVKTHHSKITRLAFVIGHAWQQWIIQLARLFIDPEIKVFNKEELETARTWIKK